jgi:copper chaperone CopZ
MIRIALATAVVGGALAAYGCFFTCGAGNAVAGTSTEVSDAADPHCDKATATAHADAADADCDPANCDESNCDKSKHSAKVQTAAHTAPADGDDTPCHYSAQKTQTVLASTTKVLHVENATCGSCIVPIREELTALKGIETIEGGEDFKDVIVTLSKDSKVSDAQLIAAVKKAGYTAIIKVVEAPQQS